MKKSKTPPSKKSIIRDGVHPRDFRTLNIQYACEHCSYFDDVHASCLMGFNCSLHLRKNQLKSYELTGKMALCRVLEID